MSIGGICLAELRTHPLFLHADLDPEREEEENENDDPRTWEMAIAMLRKPVRIPV
jgi:hypothetical protein